LGYGQKEHKIKYNFMHKLVSFAGNRWRMPPHQSKCPSCCCQNGVSRHFRQLSGLNSMLSPALTWLAVHQK